MADIPVAIPRLDNSFGALLIGCILGAALWGVGTLQTYWYYTTYPKDRVELKTFVAVVWIVDTVQEALIGHVVYYYLVQNYFNPLNLDHYVWSLNVQSLFEAITSLLVQGFFVYRILRLSGQNFYLSGVAAILVLAKFGLGVAYVAEGVPLHSIKLAFSKLHRTSEAINGLAAATDVVIAILMCGLLYRSRTGFDASNRIVNTLIMYTINTGALTSLCAVISLVTAQTMPTNFVYGAFYFLIARLYVNSMLATLNARGSLSRKAGTEIHMNQLEIEQTSGGSSNLSNLSKPRFALPVSTESLHKV